MAMQSDFSPRFLVTVLNWGHNCLKNLTNNYYLIMSTEDEVHLILLFCQWRGVFLHRDVEKGAWLFIIQSSVIRID
jgi:hypothetical protein